MKIDRPVVVYALIAVCALLVLGVVAVFAIGGSAETVTARAAIITGNLVPVLGVLVLLARQSEQGEQIRETRENVNGHLRQHIGHTDAEVRDLVRAEIERAGITAGGRLPEDSRPPIT